MGKAGRRRLLAGVVAILLALAILLAPVAQRLPMVMAAALAIGFVLIVPAGHRLWVYCKRLRRLPSLRRGTRFEKLPVPLMRFAADGRILAANAEARAMLDATRLSSRLAHEVFEDLGRPISDWIADVAADRHPGGPEVLRLRGKDAESFVQLTLRRTAAGEVLAVLHDATAIKRLEAQFTQSQKMQAIGQLAGGVAHDFNNLLTAISGHCELLLLRRRPSDPDHDDLQQIQQNAYRAAALVRQLLAFSRKQTLVPERIDLGSALGEVNHLLHRLIGGSVSIDMHHAPAPLVIRVDRQQFEQIMMNLALNARDAMPGGGVLRIETAPVTLREGLQRGRVTLPPGRYATIRLADQGTGIAPENLDKIFEPFFTTKRAGEGTGLGLATVYGIVKQSGGYIFVASTLGAGTEFELWFPAQEAAPEAPADPAPRPKARIVQGTVLLVEDEAPVRAFAARALRLRGLTVIEATQGEEALALLAGDMTVDVVVSDVVLPGMDGPTWVGRALQARPGLPVVFISGYAAEAAGETQARIENSVFLSKPFSLAELTTAVLEQIQRAHPSESEA